MQKPLTEKAMMEITYDDQDSGHTTGAENPSDGRNRWTDGPLRHSRGGTPGSFVVHFPSPNMDVSKGFDFKYRVFLNCTMAASYAVD